MFRRRFASHFRPRPIKKLIAPICVVVFVGVFRGPAIGRVVGKFSSSSILISKVIDGQPAERRSQVVAKSASGRICLAEVAAKKPQRELLSQIFGDVGVADASQQIPKRRSSVSEEKFNMRGVRTAGMRLFKQRPHCGDSAEPLIDFFTVHRRRPKHFGEFMSRLP
jgi:hypothetical protein